MVEKSSQAVETERTAPSTEWRQTFNRMLKYVLVAGVVTVGPASTATTVVGVPLAVHSIRMAVGSISDDSDHVELEEVAEFQKHTIKENDTLYSLSKQYGISVATIQKANGLKSNLIKAGETLKIPLSETKSTATPEKTLQTKKEGQYVKKIGGEWVEDTDTMKEGAQNFEAQNWEDHPDWNDSYLKRNRVLSGGRVKMKEVKYIILHSTISRTSAHTIKKHNAHFVLERNGGIKYLVSVDKKSPAKNRITPHAGVSMWSDDKDLNTLSIGIEVVAKAGQEWSEDQYEAVTELVNWLGGYYGLKKHDVLRHKQIAFSRSKGRGRKSDPMDEDLFENLGLPNNDELLDVAVTNEWVKPNLKAIRNDSNHEGVWAGLEAAEWLRKQ